MRLSLVNYFLFLGKNNVGLSARRNLTAGGGRSNENSRKTLRLSVLDFVNNARGANFGADVSKPMSEI
jgi:hypothetical protein